MKEEIAWTRMPEVSPKISKITSKVVKKHVWKKHGLSAFPIASRAGSKSTTSTTCNSTFINDVTIFIDNLVDEARRQPFRIIRATSKKGDTSKPRHIASDELAMLATRPTDFPHCGHGELQTKKRFIALAIFNPFGPHDAKACTSMEVVCTPLETTHCICTSAVIPPILLSSDIVHNNPLLDWSLPIS